jgi:hypothetical protein
MQVFKALSEPMQSFSRRCQAVLLIAALLTMPLYSTAQSTGTPTYAVELVIFRNLGTGGSPEQWAASTPIPAPDQDAEAAAPNAAESTFPKLPPERFKLDAIYDTLRRSRAYQPLAHVGWTQPGVARDSAKFVSLGELGVDGGVTGRAALARGRYLHLTLDLSLQLPGEDTRYVLKQTRRMRSTEIHYIDHPRFGVVAVVTPVAQR